MTLSKKFEPKAVEEKWYAHWLKHKFFKSTPDEREAYTIVIPPPNVTGVLHMGHILNNTIQDVLIRRARMQGFNACWVPGTDHASIATEAKVVNQLKEKGVSKWDIGRDEFMKHAFAWKDQYGGIILNQLQKLGASCDWDRTRFTMEPKLSDAVIDVFVDLYEKGLIYKGYRMTNWDPSAKTVVSDEEVYHKESMAKLYYVRYQVKDSQESVTIATTRPETIMGDSGVCFHPEDDRYKHLKGAKILVPLIHREIPTIFDDYVDVEFGTGALKVTPAHDTNDFAIGKRHNLEVIDTLDAEGKLNEKAQIFVGEDRFKARKLVVNALKNAGHLVKIEEINHKVGHSERTHVVIEPRLTDQWFVNMKHLAEPAKEAVDNGYVEFFPEHFKNTYFHWMNNITDWCISRQLWWGQRIPAYYLEDGFCVVAKSKEEALEKAKTQTGRQDLTLADLRQDEDVVDTWFSSWLWPMSVFNGFESKEELNYYFPTNVLVTGFDIIFFWVARMIMAGIEWENDRPFKHVYFTGMVRDEQRRKMSKSLGNSPDPLDLIAKYGADGVRVGMLMCAPAGGDLLFTNDLCEQGSKFSNKIWNAFRLVKGWEVKEGKNENNLPAIKWIENKYNKVLEDVEKSYEKYRLSEALNNLYSFTWTDFFSTYLEMIKPPYGEPIDAYTHKVTINFFEKLMKTLHPIMPFITEEIYHLLQERKEKDCIVVAEYPTVKPYSEAVIAKGEVVTELFTSIRNIRNKNGLSPHKKLKAFCQSKEGYYKAFLPIIMKEAALESLEFESTGSENAVSFIVNNDEFFIETGVTVDVEAERKRMSEELKYNQGFKESILRKLQNERFVNNAPTAVVDNEKKKLSDAEEKIRLLEESLAKLN